MRHTGNAEVAADLTAEVLAAALGVAHRYRPERSPTAAAWLFTIAHHTLLRSLRRGRVEERTRPRRIGIRDAVAFDDEEIERVQATADADGWALELLERLPPEQRQAVCGRILEERSYPDIADELKTSELVVRQRVSRRLSALRTRMERQWLVDGKLGVLGRDGAFGDDGRFHELRTSAPPAPYDCTNRDASGRIFTNVTVGDEPASGWAAMGRYAYGGCMPATSTSTDARCSPTRSARPAASAISTTGCSAPTPPASPTCSTARATPCPPSDPGGPI
jgi:RNA polymerase sigma factor (sigma-70 family)